MTIRVGIAAPLDRDGPVAEFRVEHNEVLAIPAEIFRDNGVLMIAIFSRDGGVSWEYPVSDFLQAIEAGVSLLGDGDTVSLSQERG